MHSCCNLPVVVGELDIVSRHKDLAILQPDEVRLGNTLGHTSEHGTAPCWFGHRLRPLKKLGRSWGGAEGRVKMSTENICCLFSLPNNTGLYFMDSHTPTYKYLLTKRQIVFIRSFYSHSDFDKIPAFHHWHGHFLFFLHFFKKGLMKHPNYANQRVKGHW